METFIVIFIMQFCKCFRIELGLFLKCSSAYINCESAANWGQFIWARVPKGNLTKVPPHHLSISVSISSASLKTLNLNKKKAEKLKFSFK